MKVAVRKAVFGILKLGWKEWFCHLLHISFADPLIRKKSIGEDYLKSKYLRTLSAKHARKINSHEHWSWVTDSLLRLPWRNVKAR